MGTGFIGDIGVSTSTSSGAGGSQFGNFNVTDDSGGGLPSYAKVGLLLGGFILLVLVIKRIFK